MEKKYYKGIDITYLDENDYSYLYDLSDEEVVGEKEFLEVKNKAKSLTQKVPFVNCFVSGYFNAKRNEDFEKVVKSWKSIFEQEGGEEYDYDESLKYARMGWEYYFFLKGIDITYLRDSYLSELKKIPDEILESEEYRKYFSIKNRACYYSTQKKWKTQLKRLENVFTNLYLYYTENGYSEKAKKIIIDDEFQSSVIEGYKPIKDELEIFANLAEWYSNNGLETSCPLEEARQNWKNFLDTNRE